MKKIFAALLVGLMALSVAACSNNNNAQTGSQQTGSQQSSVAEESKLAEITKTDSTKDDYLTDTKLYNCFYAKTTEDNVRIKMSGNMEISGSTMSMDIEMQKQGDNSYASMTMMGINAINIQKDGYKYSLNSMTKTYTKEKVEADEDSSEDQGAEALESVMGSLKDLKFVENGASSEEGTTDYEKYSVADTTMTVYFDGDNVKYIDIEQTTSSSSESSTSSSAESQKVRMDITVTNDIDESLFEIPEGYTEASSDDTLGDVSLADGVSLVEEE